MYADENLNPVHDGQVYIAPNGTKYPGKFPKDLIPGLTKVQISEPPSDEQSVITGFVINANYEQVWETKQKSGKALREENLRVLKTLRNAKLYGGLELNGISIGTDDLTQNRIHAARTKAVADPDVVLDWKSNDGFVRLDADAIIMLSDAVFSHVQKCFAAEKSVSDRVNSFKTRDAVEEAFHGAYDAH